MASCLHKPFALLSRSVPIIGRHFSLIRAFSSKKLSSIQITWLSGDKTKEWKTETNIGDNLLQVAKKYDIDLEGACEGSCACSTCHVILQDDVFEQTSEPTENEEDLLDLAFGLTSTSRLGCQVKVIPQMHNTTIQLPTATRNFAVDGFKPTPH